MSQNHFQNLLWNIGIKSDFGSYFTDKPHQRYCANHDNKATFGYYCSKCDYFICGTCVNVDIDKECLEKHLTFWCRNRDEYCFKHKGISNSGFYCIEGHFAFICDDCNNTKEICLKEKCLKGHKTSWVGKLTSNNTCTKHKGKYNSGYYYYDCNYFFCDNCSENTFIKFE